MRHRGCLPFAVLILLLSTSARADLAADRAELYASYQARLDELAGWCREHDQGQAAAQLAAWMPRRDPDKLTLFVATSSARDDGKSDVTDARPEWRTRWQTLRSGQADALVSLAQRAAAEHRPSLACELLTEAVRENPDHKLARRVLGYVRVHDTWRTPFEARQLSAGKVFHETFGWLPKSHVARYEQGQRFYRGRWMTTEEERAVRSDLKRGWRIESDHYVVTTNHSLEAGVALSARLEKLYSVWQQAFAGYVTPEAELVRRFEGRSTRRDATQHAVVYFRNRQEYNAALRSAQAKIEMSLGIYFAQSRTAYFFAGDEQEPGTLYHEATHQLFQETRAVAAEPGRSGNFWIVEGIACYMESLTAGDDGWVTLGGAHAGRMDGARSRLLVDNFYVPLAQLVDFSMESLQRQARLAELYGESAGLADFLMHSEGGRYRDALVRYLDAIYAGRATRETLAELAGTSYETLDQQYRAYMSATQVGAPSVGAR